MVLLPYFTRFPIVPLAFFYRSIFHEGDRQDRELDLGRVLAVNLGKNGLDVEQYAKLIRAASRLEEFGIGMETAYQKVVELLSACYRYDLSPPDLVQLLKPPIPSLQFPCLKGGFHHFLPIFLSDVAKKHLETGTRQRNKDQIAKRMMLMEASKEN